MGIKRVLIYRSMVGIEESIDHKMVEMRML